MRNVFLLDTAGGAPREIGKARAEPAFLTSRYIWWLGMRPCAAADPYPCNSTQKSTPTGKAYIYDLQTGTEVESIIAEVFDVWPHPV